MMEDKKYSWFDLHPFEGRFLDAAKTRMPDDLPSPDFASGKFMAPLTRHILSTRYLRTPEGKRLQTSATDAEYQFAIKEMLWRVSIVVACRGWATGSASEATIEEAKAYYESMSELDFLPNTPTLTGAGTPLSQLAACFVLPIEDDIGRESRSGIFSTLLNAAVVTQSGGGIGFDFSNLRPAGSEVRSSGGLATGPISFLQMYDYAMGTIAQGGCLTRDTLVYTDFGTLRLDELVDVDQIGWKEHFIAVATDDGVRASRRNFNNGFAPVRHVTTDCGMEICGTREHRVKIITADGPSWRSLGDLSKGDYIMMMRNQHRGAIQSLKYRHVFDETVAYVVGYLGILNSSGANAEFNAVHDNDFKDLHQMIEKAFGTTSDLLLKQIFMNEKLFSDESVPSIVRCSPPSVVGAYLRGLLEVTGIIYANNNPRFLFGNKCLAQQVAVLLIGLGCPVYLEEIISGDWVVTIVSQVGQQAWKQWIGCDPKSRFAKMGAATESLIVPYPSWWLGAEFAKEMHLPRLITMCSYDLLMATKIASKFSQSMHPVGDYWFAEVKEVEDTGTQLTLDLENDSNHTYIANGMVTHNTRRGACMAVMRYDHPDIMKFIRLKADAATAGRPVVQNFNLSVSVDDNFLSAVSNGGNIILVDPSTKKPVGILHSSELMDAIAECAHKYGEPGVLFVDEANRHNPLSELYKFTATNPCVVGETLIAIEGGTQEARSLVGIPVRLQMPDGTVAVSSKGFFLRGVEKVVEVGVAGFDLPLVCAADHRLLCILHKSPYDTTAVASWIPVSRLRPGDTWVCCAGVGTWPARQMLASGMPVQPDVCVDCILKCDWKRVVFINEPRKPREVYDVHIDDIQPNKSYVRQGHRCYIANGLLSHNCGKLGYACVDNFYTGEQWLGPYECCCLGSINLANHISEDGEILWDKLQQSVIQDIRFLDASIDANAFINGRREFRDAMHSSRRVGLDFTGLADVFFARGVRYGSTESLDIAQQIEGFIKYWSLMASTLLAQEFGKFEAYDKSIFAQGDDAWLGVVWPARGSSSPVTDKIAANDIESAARTPTGRPELDMELLLKRVHDYGVRNAALTTLAPTGTRSTIFDTDGSGCEPAYALVYERKIKNPHDDKSVTVTLRSKKLFKALHKYFTDGSSGPATEALKMLDATTKHIIDNDGMIIDGRLGDEIERVFTTSRQIPVEDHIAMVAALQRHTCNSISKTINMPSSSTAADVRQAVLLAANLGCRGITVYVDKSREDAILTTSKKTADTTETLKPSQKPSVTARARNAPLMDGLSMRLSTTQNAEVNVVVNRDAAGAPFEVFVNADKNGSDISQLSQAIGRLISLALRCFSDPFTVLENAITELEGVGRQRARHEKGVLVSSIPDAIAQVLTHATKAHPAAAATINPVVPSPEPARALTVRCETTQMTTVFITVEFVDNEIRGLILNAGKAGSDIAVLCEAIARMVTLIFQTAAREGYNTVSAARLVVEQLQSIGGSATTPVGNTWKTSIPDAVARVIDSAVTDRAAALGRCLMSPPPSTATLSTAPAERAVWTGRLCPTCKNNTLVYTQSCVSCKSCDYYGCP